jgi:glycosyltransferase involved in cell wall biosynthesis
MKILHVNTSDTSGSAIAAKRLSTELRNKGIDSKLLALDVHSFGDNSIEPFFNVSGSKIYKLKSLIQRHLLPSYRQTKLKVVNPDDNIFTYPNTLIDITKHHLYQEADIIHLHNVADFINIPQFFRRNSKPIVWTLHDMNPFTGGNHLPLNINHGFTPHEKQSNNNLKIKAESYKLANKLIVTAPSRWLMSEAIESNIFANRQIHHIPNGINTKHFKPYNRDFARQLLSIPESSKKYILFIADDLRLSNKGSVFFLQIYNRLKEKYNFVIAGKGSNNAIFTDKNIINLGYINSEYLLPVVFSCCDISLVLSKVETFSLTTLESISCGVPVISTNCKGPEEILEDNENGYIVNSNSPDDFVNIIEHLLNNEQQHQLMRIKSVETAQNYDISSISDRFIQIYNNII